MLRISVLGATGKVGTSLLDAIASAPDLSLSEAISASGADGSVPLAEATFDGADVVIDFSSPSGTMALLDRLQGRRIPVVVGATGFGETQAQRLAAEGRHRPIMVGANFTQGFEALARAARGLAAALPEAAVTVGEVYNAAKKLAASGTTMRLCREVGEGGRPVETEIQRIGDTPGINSVTFDYGAANIALTLTVRSRTAYAAGALDAARWLISQPNGAYAPADMLTN